MSESKAYASLSSGLLARKGGAKPAMRPQAFTNFGGQIEDLGWNDMGGPEIETYDHVPSSISALTPAPNKHTPHNKTNTPKKNTQTNSFVASARAITGTTLVVDGGQHLLPLSRDVMYLAQ